MPTRVAINQADHSNEKSSTLIWLQDLNAVNYASVTQDADELKDAVDLICLGTIQDVTISKTFPEATGYPSTDPLAQREAKWLVTYQDIVQFLDDINTISNPGYLKIFTTELPCAKLSLLPAGRDELDITTGDGLTFANSFKVNARSPYNNSEGHTTTPLTEWVKVLSIKAIGKNS